MKYNRYADELSRVLTMQDVIHKYTHLQPRKDRVPCPFHDGKDYNFAFNDQVFQCFVCGRKGNIFRFVMDYFNLDFQQAIQKLQYDFNIGAPPDDLRAKRRARAAEQDRIKERRKQEKEQVEVIQQYERLELIWACYDEILRQYAPETPEEELRPHYIEALHNIKYYEYLLGLAEMKRGAGIG